MAIDDVTANPLKDKVLDAVLTQAPFDGWTRAAIDNAVRQGAITRDEAALAFPGGVIDMIAWHSLRADRMLVDAQEIATSGRIYAWRCLVRQIMFVERTEADYAALRHRLYESREPDRFELPASAVTAALVRALESPRPKAHYYVTLPTHLMGMARRILPVRMLDWLIAKG